MDTEEIQNRLENLGKAHFTNVVRVFLSKIFGFTAINLDGSGDGGIDWWLFEKDGRRVRIAIQDTIQIQKWQDKALADAKSATKNYSINRYFFITNRCHKPINIITLENRITDELGIPATILEAKSIAQLIIDGDLINDFLTAIGQPSTLLRPQIPELALCGYTNLSADRLNHRNEIYEDTILIVCREKQPVSRDDLVLGALTFLGSASGQRQLIDRRVDSLLSDRRLIKNKEDQSFSLSSATNSSLEQTERLYFSDWISLTGSQTVIIQEMGGQWSEGQAELATTIIARLFMREQLENLKSARADLIHGLWFDSSGDPKQQFRDLLQDSGIPPRNISEAFSKIIELARGREVITKLTRTAVFASLEGQNPLQAARAIGAASWDDVKILLDASVAIPFLCASRTESVDTYLYALSSKAVELLSGLGSSACISAGHLEECASHLLRAFRYESLGDDADFSEALRQSDNAFVAFYYALRSEGRRAPSSLHEFLQIFSERAPMLLARNDGSWKDSVHHVMPDLQEGFADYDIPLQYLSKLPRERFDELQKTYDVAMHDLKRNKSEILRRHDIDALSHIQERVSRNHESWLFLTWDRSAIQFAAEHLTTSWVVSPEVAMDFAQPCKSLSEAQWSTLAHRLARVGNPKDTLTARILDQAAHIHHKRLQDWEFKQQIRAFRDQALGRLPVENEVNFHAWVEAEVAAFFEKIKPDENLDGISSINVDVDGDSPG